MPPCARNMHNHSSNTSVLSILKSISCKSKAFGASKTSQLSLIWGYHPWHLACAVHLTSFERRSHDTPSPTLTTLILSYFSPRLITKSHHSRSHSRHADASSQSWLDVSTKRSAFDLGRFLEMHLFMVRMW
jgi:hypothetical protein